MNKLQNFLTVAEVAELEGVCQGQVACHDQDLRYLETIPSALECC